MNSNINYLIPESVFMGIYKIIAPDGHFYIGSSKNIQKRIKRHFNYLSRNLKIKENREWQFRYNAHPEWVWTCKLLEVVATEDLLLCIEQKYLDIFYKDPLCMNANPFAAKPPCQKGIPKTEEWKTKMKKRVPWNKGKKRAIIKLPPKNLKGRKQTQNHIINKIRSRIGMKYKTRKDKGISRVKMKEKPWSEARKRAWLNKKNTTL